MANVMTILAMAKCRHWPINYPERESERIGDLAPWWRWRRWGNLIRIFALKLIKITDLLASSDIDWSYFMLVWSKVDLNASKRIRNTNYEYRFLIHCVGHSQWLQPTDKSDGSTLCNNDLNDSCNVISIEERTIGLDTNRIESNRIVHLTRLPLYRCPLRSILGAQYLQWIVSGRHLWRSSMTERSISIDLYACRSGSDWIQVAVSMQWHYANRREIFGFCGLKVARLSSFGYNLTVSNFRKLWPQICGFLSVSADVYDASQLHQSSAAFILIHSLNIRLDLAAESWHQLSSIQFYFITLH